jgi:hypothetical protein
MAFDNHVERVHAKGRDSECLGLSMVEYTRRFRRDAALALNHARKGIKKKVIEMLAARNRQHINICRQRITFVRISLPF